MKVLKTLGLLALTTMIFYSCFIRYAAEPPEFVIYNLGLSFQDTSGNDLVKGIGLREVSPSGMSGTVIPDLYVLDVIISEPCKNWDNEVYNTPARPGFDPDINRPKLGINNGMDKFNNGEYYLTNSFWLPVDGCPEIRILTYKLKCPYVFGNEEVHEFVTYWDIPKTKAFGSDYHAKCLRIEFEGNEIFPQAPIDERNTYGAIIVLNGDVSN